MPPNNDIERQLGEIQGEMKYFREAIKELSNKVDELMSDRNKMIGVFTLLIISGVIGSAVTQVWHKLFGH